MKMALISTPFVAVPPRDYGGTELVIHELAEGLVERGHEVTLFATGDSATSAELGVLYPEPVWPPDALTESNHLGWAMARYAGATRAGDYVCYIGRLSQVKGPHLAIDAAERAGVPIHVAGRIHRDDPDPAFAVRELEPRLARPHVRYLGAVGMAEKVALLREARALLMPIGWEEPFGLVMIEAMLAGCPVIAFPRGSAPERVEPGVSGYLVDDVAAMADATRNRLDAIDREACRAYAIERFGRERMVAAYESHCRRTLGATPSGTTPLAATA